MSCRHCGTEVTADDEDELVTQVQTHARSHDGGPELSREHILSRLHRLQRRQAEES
ncbi:MAG: DUF1059 domain-containing protein [Actinobacteria bacterium]|nr:DUF1059 domain-containing protein [Actinomycetota bacterium]